LVWQHELGKLMDDIGAVSSALEVYLRLQSWENVIACYTKLGYQQKVRTSDFIYLQYNTL